MTQEQKDYRDYHRYMTRNRPTDEPLSFEAFTELHSDDEPKDSDDWNSKSSPLHY